MQTLFKILIYGYGNPGRQDDSLGVELSKRLESWVNENGIRDVECDANYQLNIEDAAAIAEKDIVVFADASQEEIEDFCISRVTGSSDASFTTHAASPGYIYKLCEEIFDKKPLVLLIHIKGYQWEFAEGLSAQAEINLLKAVEYLKRKILHPESLFQIDKDRYFRCPEENTNKK